MCYSEGKTVAIKKLSYKSGEFQLTKTVRKEVMQIRYIYLYSLFLDYSCMHMRTLHRSLDHANLCKFIGATLRGSGNATIITEYCPKGSLNDVLQNDGKKFDA